MEARDPEYHTTNDDDPGQHNTAVAFIIEAVSEELVKVKAARLPAARVFAKIHALKLPPRQTFASADDFAVYLVRQYQARAQKRGLALDCLEMILLPTVAAEVFTEFAAAGRSLAEERTNVRLMELL